MPPRSTPNFYALLKVERDATHEQIEQAFDAARHTALCDGAGHDLIELLEQAFLTLSDPAMRREHDAALADLEGGGERPCEARRAIASAPMAPEAHDAGQRDASTSSGDHDCILVACASALSAGGASAASVEAVLESAHPFYAAESSAPFSGGELSACQACLPSHADSTAALSDAPTRPPSKPPIMATPRSTPPRGIAAPSGLPQRAGEARDAHASSTFTGAQLRRIREARGLSLRELSELTKVSLSHLENIEAERFALLPPPVYLRGFLMLIASALKLDPLRVTKEFLDQMPVKPG